MQGAVGDGPAQEGQNQYQRGRKVERVRQQSPSRPSFSPSDRSAS
jgi:hypothetical protein